jgi:hypothetical protein
MRRKIHTQLQIIEILYFYTSISLMLINALNYKICHLDSPFSKYFIFDQRQDGRILPSLDFFHPRIHKSDQAFILKFFHPWIQKYS